MIAIGKIVKAVGLKGEIKVYPYSTDPSLYEGCTVYIAEKPYILRALRYQKGMAYLTLQDITHIDQVQSLLDQEILMRRADIELEEDEFFHADLIGLEVFDEQDHSLGVVKEILSPSSQELLVVQGEREIFIPMVDQFILEIDLTKKQIKVRLMEGL